MQVSCNFKKHVDVKPLCVLCVVRVFLHVGHGEICVAVSPSKLDGHIRTHKVIASKESCCKTSAILNRHEEAEKFFC